MSAALFRFLVLATLLMAGAPWPSARAQSPAPKKKKPSIALLETRVSGTFDPKTVAGLDALVASELSRHPLRVVAGSDLSALIGFDRQKQLLGCTEGSCLAEVGGALGVDFLLTTEISELGGVMLLSMTVLDTGRAQAVKRLAKRVDHPSQLIETASAAVAELVPALLPGTAAPQPPPQAGPAPAIAPKDPRVAAQAEPASSGARIAAFALGGAGLGALAAGGIVGGLAWSSYSDAKALAEGGDPARKAEFETAKADFSSRANLANVLLGAGAVALAGGAALYFLGADDAPPPVAAALTPTSASLVFSGEF